MKTFKEISEWWKTIPTIDYNRRPYFDKLTELLHLPRPAKFLSVAFCEELFENFDI